MPAGLHARDLVRVPGLISFCRLPLAVAFPFAAGSVPYAIALLCAAAATDALDGWYARRFHQETPAGAVLDGVMDKVFALSVVCTLLLRRWLSPLGALALGAREIGEAPLLVRALLRRDRPPNRHREASALGKLATTLQFVAVTLVLLRIGPRGLALGAAAACGALAAAGYLRREVGA